MRSPKIWRLMMFSRKFFLSTLLLPCVLFSNPVLSNMDDSQIYKSIAECENKLFNQIRSQLDTIKSCSLEKKTFENSLGSFIKSLYCLRSSYKLIETCIFPYCETLATKQQIKHDFKRFLREYIIENEELTFALEQYCQKAIYQNHKPNVSQTLAASFLENPFPQFITLVLQISPALNPNVRSYLHFCRSETEVYFKYKGKDKSNGEQEVGGSVSVERNNDRGSYGFDVTARRHRDREGNTTNEGEVSLKIKRNYKQ